MTDERAELDRFSGLARLFPLPNLVMFPNIDQGLHIFEPRYRQMTADALASDHLLALVLLKPGWEETYEGRPEIERVACLGRITRSEKLPDGRYNLRLRGRVRFRVDEEVQDRDKLYRLARGSILADEVPADLCGLTALRRELREVVLGRFDPNGATYRQLGELFAGDMPVAEVCDTLGYALPIPLEVKQQLLAEVNVARRVRLLADTLRGARPADHRFPPAFSPN